MRSCKVPGVARRAGAGGSGSCWGCGNSGNSGDKAGRPVGPRVTPGHVLLPSFPLACSPSLDGKAPSPEASWQGPCLTSPEWEPAAGGQPVCPVSGGRLDWHGGGIQGPGLSE